MRIYATQELCMGGSIGICRPCRKCSPGAATGYELTAIAATTIEVPAMREVLVL